MRRIRFRDPERVLKIVAHCVGANAPLVLAHDGGVYICCEGLTRDGRRLLCAYADRCDPSIDRDWFDTAAELVGEDDFVERIDIAGLPELVERLRNGERLVIDIAARRIWLDTEPPPPTAITPAGRGHGDGAHHPTRARRSTMSKKSTKRSPSRKPVRMSASAARAEGEQRTKRALAAAKATVAANLKAIAAADQENATKRDQRKAAADGMTPAERAVAAEPKPPRASALNAAAAVLDEIREPMTCDVLIREMAARNLWQSPKGKTPEATLYAAIVREIKAKGAASRFRRSAVRGMFVSATRAL